MKKNILPDSSHVYIISQKQIQNIQNNKNESKQKKNPVVTGQIIVQLECLSGKNEV